MEPRTSRALQAMPNMVPFVAPEALEARLGVKFRLRMGANESAFGPSPMAIEAIRNAAGRAAWYGDPQAVALREVLAERQGVSFDEITVGAGIDELLILLCRAFVDAGDAIVSSFGGYPTFEFAALGAGANLVRVPYRNDAPDLEAMAAAAIESNARIAYLANPDNPSGASSSVDAVGRLRASLPETCLLVLDEAYADFVTPAELPPSMPMTVRLRTFSKAHGLAGLRVGYALGSPGVGKALDKVRPHFGVNAVGQAAALASLADEAYLRDVVAAISFGRMELMETARRLGFPTRPTRTNFVLFDAGTREAAEALLDRLLRAGVFVRKPGHPPLDRFIRVTVGTTDDHEEFGKVLEQVGSQLYRVRG